MTLSDLDLTGLRYNPLTRKYSLHAGDVDVNYLLHASRDACDPGVADQ